MSTVRNETDTPTASSPATAGLRRTVRPVQSPPLLFTGDGHSVPLGDVMRGCAAFLIAGGPSFASVDRALLETPGCLTMGLNNSAKTFRPCLWCSVDDPSHFMKSIWLDPRILKFVPAEHARKPIFDNEAWQTSGILVGDCPNVLFYRRNERFDADRFLTEETINWGDHARHGGGRSVMLPALRLLHFLGVRTVYLLGVDFRMTADSTYHFEQDRSQGSIVGNTKTYHLMTQRFRALLPSFEEAGFAVYNCNPESALDVFPFVTLKEAIAAATAELPSRIAAERTAGLYDRKANERAARKSLHSTMNGDGTPPGPRPEFFVPSVIPAGPLDGNGDGEGEAPEGAVVLLFADTAEVWQLEWWWRNYVAHNRMSVSFVADGLGEVARNWCEKHGQILESE